MTHESFKWLHSNIIMHFQLIEFNLKRIYSKMSTGTFAEGMDLLETSNLGNTLRKLKDLDNSDGKPWFSDSEYNEFDHIREMRNYWCHQCYLDYLFIQNNRELDIAFQRVAKRLVNDYDRIKSLSEKIENLYFDWFID